MTQARSNDHIEEYPKIHLEHSNEFTMHWHGYLLRVSIDAIKFGLLRHNAASSLVMRRVFSGDLMLRLVKKNSGSPPRFFLTPGDRGVSKPSLPGPYDL